MTHRVFSRNAASSRAIPIDKMIQGTRDNMAIPVHWGLNQAGMQAKGQHTDIINCEDVWMDARERAIESALELKALGLHKQIVNRVLEPFQTMKTIVTATEWDNFFELRDHEDAQPEIRALAIEMRDAISGTEVVEIPYMGWHVPYVDRKIVHLSGGVRHVDYSVNGEVISLDEALKVSASCCAQVSYRVLDNGLEKALKIYASLVDSRPVHASPFEHQASPTINQPELTGNFVMWKQYRKIIEVTLNA